MSLPVFGFELARARLSKRAQTAAAIQATLYDPEGARDVGFLDEVVPAEALEGTAMARASAFAEFSPEAYANNKLGIRREAIETIEASLR